jgi:hypothetical protein
VEPSVGGDDVIGFHDAVGELSQFVQPGRRYAGRGHLRRLAGQRGEDGEIVDGVLRRDADDIDATARGDGYEPLIGQLEERLADRGAADPELSGQLFEVEAISRPQSAGEDPVSYLIGRLGPNGRADELDI